MIDFDFDEGAGIIRVRRTGFISVDEMLDCIQRIGREFKEFNKLYILEYTYNSETDDDIELHFDLIIKEIINSFSGYEIVKHAILVDRPIETANSYIFQRHAQKVNNYYVNVFSTEEAGIDWLKSH